jgi:hypothetical protein
MATVAYVEQANKETKQAVVFQSKARRVSFTNSNLQKEKRITAETNFRFYFFLLLFFSSCFRAILLSNELLLPVKYLTKKKNNKSTNFTFFNSKLNN